MKRFALNVISSFVFIAGALAVFGQDDSTKRPLMPAVDSTLDTSTNDVVATTGTSDSTSKFLVQNSSASPLFTVRSDGRVGIGTASPTVALAIDTGAVRAEQNMTTSHTSGPIIRFRQNAGWAANRAIGAINFLNDTGWTVGQIATVYSNDSTSLAANIIFNSNTIERMRIDHLGNVGIGTGTPTARLHVNGNIIANGSITGATVIGSVYQDLAEWVPSNEDLAPGTVVVLDRAVGNGVKASATGYDTTVAGVVSAQPGILLGVADASKEQIATTGRVRVKVDASGGAIEVGDLLVTSDRPGYAMRSVPVDVAGISLHRPGTIIGKALEALPSGSGEILVLLSLQ